MHKEHFADNYYYRAHLIHDLRPYICTYKECRTPGQLYDSRKDWIQHEDRNHRRVFRCPEHEDQSFGTLAEYEQHIRVQHDQNASAHEGLFANHLAESTQLKSDRCCPVCSLALETAQMMQSHIALHLERLSLFSMPRSVGDDVGSQAIGSENAVLDIEGSGAEDLDVQLTFSDDGNSIVCNEVEVDEAEGNDDLYQHCLEFENFGMEVNPVSMATMLKEVEKIDRLLEKDDPGSLASMADLALEYFYEGKLNEAEKLQVHVMQTHKRVLGDEHADTLKSMSDLAKTYRKGAREDEAASLQLHVMETRKRIFGDEHPDTLKSMAKLAYTYYVQDRFEEAERLLLQVVDIRKRSLGDGHPQTLASIMDLATTYSVLGRGHDAEKLREHVTRTRKRTFSKDHPDTIESMVSPTNTSVPGPV